MRVERGLGLPWLGLFLMPTFKREVIHQVVQPLEALEHSPKRPLAPEIAPLRTPSIPLIGRCHTLESGRLCSRSAVD